MREVDYMYTFSPLCHQSVDTNINSVVGTVSATDLDTSSNGEIRYAIASGNIGSK